MIGISFACRGCGQPAWYFPDGYTKDGCDIGPGCVAHSKPKASINRVPVQCALFQRLEPHEFWALHEQDERLEPLTDLRPIRG